jgi:hypothetical protein
MKPGSSCRRYGPEQAVKVKFKHRKHVRRVEATHNISINPDGIGRITQDNGRYVRRLGISNRQHFAN